MCKFIIYDSKLKSVSFVYIIIVCSIVEGGGRWWVVGWAGVVLASTARVCPSQNTIPAIKDNALDSSNNSHL